jgi:hypothetical protein
VIQELQRLLRAANQLVEEIGVRLKNGDAADDQVRTLVGQTRIISRYIARMGDGLSEDCRREFHQLLVNVQKAVTIGNGWLAQAAGPELAAQALKQKLSRAYGVPTHLN